MERPEGFDAPESTSRTADDAPQGMSLRGVKNEVHFLQSHISPESYRPNDVTSTNENVSELNTEIESFILEVASTKSLI